MAIFLCAVAPCETPPFGHEKTYATLYSVSHGRLSCKKRDAMTFAAKMLSASPVFRKIRNFGGAPREGCFYAAPFLIRGETGGSYLSSKIKITKFFFPKRGADVLLEVE